MTQFRWHNLYDILCKTILKLEQDIIKNKIQYVEKTFDDMIKQNRKEFKLLKSGKNSIINDLQKNEKDLLAKLSQNPSLWSNESLQISLKMTRSTPAVITSDVTIRKKKNPQILSNSQIGSNSDILRNPSDSEAQKVEKPNQDQGYKLDRIIEFITCVKNIIKFLQ